MATRARSDQTTSGTDAVTDERRSRRLDLRLTPTEEALIRQAAAGRRQSVTEFLVEAALAAADQALPDDRRIVLMNKVFDRLVDELDGPEQAIPALAQLIKRPRRFQLPE